MELLAEEQLNKKRIKAKKRKRRNRITILILVLLLFTAILAAAYFAYLYNKEKQNAKAEEEQYLGLQSDLDAGGYITTEESDAKIEEAINKAIAETEDSYRSAIQGYMEEGQTLLMLENLFPNNIVVPDIGRYCFFEIDETIEKNNFNPEAFVYPVLNEETDEYEGDASYDDGNITAHRGIDVSKFQGEIDWNAVKNDGIEYAFIRLGYRGYESGKIVTDEQYEANIAGCNEAGVDCGVYFFTEAVSEAEAVEEADYVLENLGDYHIELPIVIDVEQSANVNKSRTKDITKEERTQIVKAFCERIKSAGYTPMIYGNLKSLMIMTDVKELEEYDRWFAYYHYPLIFPYKMRYWQYSATGTVAGVKGDCDMNLCFY